VNQVRTFVALPLPAELRTAIDAAVAPWRRIHAPVRWVPAANMHLTLKFLGEIPRTRIPRIAEALRSATRSCTRFTLRFGPLGAFPGWRRPRVIWLGVEECPAALETLQAAVEQALVNLGFPPERRAFTPHLTLGRVKAPRGLEKLLSALQSARALTLPAIAVDAVRLYKSELRRTGAVYSVLEAFPLAGQDARHGEPHAGQPPAERKETGAPPG
jgi:2'-5' RNA ligase